MARKQRKQPELVFVGGIDELDSLIDIHRTSDLDTSAIEDLFSFTVGGINEAAHDDHSCPACNSKHCVAFECD